MSQIRSEGLQPATSCRASGLAEAHRKGQKLGRPLGPVNTKRYIQEKHKNIVRQLKQGQSIRNTAKITSKGISTVQRVKSVL